MQLILGRVNDHVFVPNKGLFHCRVS